LEKFCKCEKPLSRKDFHALADVQNRTVSIADEFIFDRSVIYLVQFPAFEKTRPIFWTLRPILAIIAQDCCHS
jgi:hypothetical protein